jgi:hypothetical protein
LESSRVLIELLSRFQKEVEAAIETLEIQQYRELLGSIERGLKNFEESRVISLKELKAKYDL